jgi:hypothetical protein
VATLVFRVHVTVPWSSGALGHTVRGCSLGSPSVAEKVISVLDAGQFVVK